MILLLLTMMMMMLLLMMMVQVTGVSHKYTPPGRSYILSYIKFGALRPRTTYYYKVKSGSSACGWSATYSFRSGYADGVTRMATYGDMGHSHYNNMENMLEDCTTGRIDAILHMGDHAYNLGYSGDRRGDAYMNALQPLLARCAWYPVIGNHEASDGDHVCAAGFDFAIARLRTRAPHPPIARVVPTVDSTTTT